MGSNHAVRMSNRGSENVYVQKNRPYFMDKNTIKSGPKEIWTDKRTIDRNRNETSKISWAH